MGDEHHWFECRPAVVTLSQVDEQTYALGLKALDRAWESLDDGQRHRFHKFTCEGDTSEATLRVIAGLKAAIEVVRRDLEAHTEE